MSDETTPACTVLRWEVPVDDDWHMIGGGKVLHVAARDRGIVEVWTLENKTYHVWARDLRQAILGSD